MNRTVAIYLRVSKADGSQSTENQRLQLIDYAERRGWQISNIYSDEVSGRKGRVDRQEFDRMFRDARLGHFDLVLFWSLDRFSREGIRQTIHYLEKLNSYGVGFHSFQEEYLSTIESELVRTILLTLLSHIAHYESQRISERTKAGLNRARLNGKTLGRPALIGQVANVMRAYLAQPMLDGRMPTNEELRRHAQRRLGKKISISTVRRAKKLITENQ